MKNYFKRFLIYLIKKLKGPVFSIAIWHRLFFIFEYETDCI